MGTSQQYSKEFKEAIVKKLLNRGNKTVSEFCKENSLNLSTVIRWQSKCAKASPSTPYFSDTSAVHGNSPDCRGG